MYTERASDQPEVHEVRVEDVTEAAEGVLSITLRAEERRTLPAWTPGAHIDVFLANGLERQYSLCGDPDDRERWRIGVLREPESRGGSEFIHASVGAGDRLRVRGPRNNFPLVAAHRYVLVAGGIGVTPLLAMVKELEKQQAEWRLLYGGRRRDSMAFLGELQEYGERVAVRPEEEHGLLDLDAWLLPPQTDTAVYCCGPEPLVQAVESRCERWDPGSLHVERFRPRPGALDGAMETFEVVLEKSGLTICVGADQTIVEAAELAGVEVDTSCREGTCGTCETVVLDGIPDHRDSCLMDEEKATNTIMMVCCSRSRSPRLVLDL
ncbi:PDR/VanB family oxidoreductase [Baekduia alba]|uniref:PDR/VanB family oxidoreductase n=1 Tax=Baekduia alba TaxID=2997333 RepID=UPI0023408015|nr:PDR/VanB family oxidoreductase [Baekduia alba]